MFPAAKRVVDREHSVNGVPLLVKLVAPESPAVRKVFVSKLPDGCEEETLELYFESTKRSGGGPVTNVLMSDCMQQAVVTFESQEGTDTCLVVTCSFCVMYPISIAGGTLDNNGCVLVGKGAENFF